MEPLESPKHEHERSTDNVEAEIRKYGKFVLFVKENMKVFSALAFGALSLYTTIQTLKADIGAVKADVAMVKIDVAEVKKEGAETKKMVADIDRKLDRLSRRSGRDLYGSAK